MASRSSKFLILATISLRRVREQCPVMAFSAKARILRARGGGAFWKYSKDMARRMASRVPVASLGTSKRLPRVENYSSRRVRSSALAVLTSKLAIYLKYSNKKSPPSHLPPSASPLDPYGTDLVKEEVRNRRAELYL
jgi:hypothetical protein